MGEEFTEEKNLTRGTRKNWWKKCYKDFRMWLLYSKLILFKEIWLILIYI